MVNGGGSVTLQFHREPFPAQSASVLVPWNQIITMDVVTMTLEDDDWIAPNPILCNVEHQYYLLRPVVLSTWQHTQLGACPEKTTIIPESQVNIHFYPCLFRISLLFLCCFPLHLFASLCPVSSNSPSLLFLCTH